MEHLLEEEFNLQEASRPRNVTIALLLSLIIPGFGQVYNGQLKKAILIFGLYLLNPLLFGLTRGATYFYGYILLIVVELGIRIFAIVDAARSARRQKNYIPKPYNTWYFQLMIAIGLLTIMYLYDAKSILGIQSFHIPTYSSEPTIQEGDRIIADLRAYKSKDPDYGDIVVFRNYDNQVFTFRIAGLPNDTLELNDDIVTINGKSSKTTFIKEITEVYSPLYEYEEVFPNGQKHKIYKMKQSNDSTRTSIKNIIVPANNYYLLGDNRDNAEDSRYNGFVDRNKIMGRIVFSYWGQSTSRVNIDFRKN